MEIVDANDTTSHRLFGHYQEMNASLGVVTTRRAHTVRVNGSKVRSTAAMLQIYLTPWDQCYATPLEKSRKVGSV